MNNTSSAITTSATIIVILISVELVYRSDCQQKYLFPFAATIDGARIGQSV
jgi:hypothetical protein